MTFSGVFAWNRYLFRSVYDYILLDNENARIDIILTESWKAFSLFRKYTPGGKTHTRRLIKYCKTEGFSTSVKTPINAMSFNIYLQNLIHTLTFKENMVFSLASSIPPLSPGKDRCLSAGKHSNLSRVPCGLQRLREEPASFCIYWSFVLLSWSSFLPTALISP